MTALVDTIHETLVAAIMESDGGSDDEWDAINTAEAILNTLSGRTIIEEIKAGRRAQAALVLIVTRHHTPEDLPSCDVCSGAIK